MNIEVIYCPGGEKSQTGTALSIRYSNINIRKCGDTIKNALDHLDTGKTDPCTVPIWNSHEGEVQAAEFIWDSIQDSKIKLIDLWAKSIEFWFIKRTKKQQIYRKIGSVKVAKTQCSFFIDKQKSELIPNSLTTVAFEKYKEGALWDGVLVAPGQGKDLPGYEVAEKKTANANNFTSFVTFVSTNNIALKTKDLKLCFTGVAMPAFGDTLSDITQTFFEALTDQITDFNNFPRLIFVFKRTANVGLLFEGTPLYTGDLLDVEEEEKGEVSIYENVGTMTNLYSDELHELFTNDFPTLTSEDFILHLGVKTCLFACPPLGLYTHGYDKEAVEPVVRFYINKIFSRFDEGVKCSIAQRNFFEQYKQVWEEKGSEFINFKIVETIKF